MSPAGVNEQIKSESPTTFHGMLQRRMCSLRGALPSSLAARMVPNMLRKPMATMKRTMQVCHWALVLGSSAGRLRPRLWAV